MNPTDNVQRSTAENTTTSDNRNTISISPRKNVLQLLGIIILFILLILSGIIAFLIIIVDGVASPGLFIIAAIFTIFTLGVLLSQFSDLILHRIIITKEDVIVRRGLFLRTQKIARRTVVDCRVQVSAKLDLVYTSLGNFGIQEKTLFLIGKQGETVGEIDVSAFAAPDIARLVSLLKSRHRLVSQSFA